MMKDSIRLPPVMYAGDVIFYFTVLLIAYCLKAHYSTAGSEELSWILQPTSWLVEFLSGREFIHESGAGYMRSDNRFVIAPACAGVNFMITAFCMTSFYGIRKKENMFAKGQYILVSLLISYGLTLLVNTLRIEVSIILYSEQVQWGWLTPDRVHRIAGIIIYFSALLLLYTGLRQTVGMKRVEDTMIGSGLDSLYRSLAAGGMAPFAWYSLIVIGIPLLNKGGQKGGIQFVEHCLMTFSVSLVVFLTFILIKLMYLLHQNEIVKK